jgi:putative lipoprotein
MYCAFRILLFITIGSTLAGCGSKDDTPELKTDAEMLTGLWHVEDIDQGGVIDYAMVTLQFSENNRIAGSTGCNRYTGEVAISDGSFVISKASFTRKACVPAVAKQEQRFLAALNDATRYEIESNTWLIISDASDTRRLALTQVESSQDPRSTRIDQSLVQGASFQCEDIGMVGLRFLGPETVEISTGDQVAILQRLRTASGAQYSGGNVLFWNKGSEAKLSLNGRDYKCSAK